MAHAFYTSLDFVAGLGHDDNSTTQPKRAGHYRNQLYGPICSMLSNKLNLEYGGMPLLIWSAWPSHKASDLQDKTSKVSITKEIEVSGSTKISYWLKEVPVTTYRLLLEEAMQIIWTHLGKHSSSDSSKLKFKQ